MWVAAAVRARSCAAAARAMARTCAARQVRCASTVAPRSSRNASRPACMRSSDCARAAVVQGMEVWVGACARFERRRVCACTLGMRGCSRCPCLTSWRSLPLCRPTLVPGTPSAPELLLLANCQASGHSLVPGLARLPLSMRGCLCPCLCPCVRPCEAASFHMLRAEHRAPKTKRQEPHETGAPAPQRRLLAVRHKHAHTRALV